MLSKVQIAHRGVGRFPLKPRLSALVALVGGMVVTVAAAAAEAPAVESKVELPALKVQGDPLEDFGFRVSPVEFWLHQVGKTSPLWPLDVIQSPGGAR